MAIIIPNINVIGSGRPALIPPKDNLLQWLSRDWVVYNSDSGYWEWKDRVGKRDEVPQEGKCYEFIGVETIQFGIAIANAVISYWNGSSRQAVTLNAAGELTGFTGKFGDAYIKDGDNYEHFWQCNEGEGITAWDSVGTAHGTIIGATLVDFHASDNRFSNLQNNIGYSEGVLGFEMYTDVGMANTSNVTKLSQNKWQFEDDGNSCLISTGNVQYRFGYIYQLIIITSESSVSDENGLYLQRFSLYENNYYDDQGIPIKENGIHVITVECTRESASYFQFQLSGALGDSVICEIVQIKEFQQGKIPFKLNASGQPTGVDIFSNAPTKVGQVKYNAEIVGNSVGVFDGVDDYVELNEPIVLLTTEIWSLEIEYTELGRTDYGCILGSDTDASRIQSTEYADTLQLYDSNNSSILIILGITIGVKNKVSFNCDGNGVITALLNDQEATSLQDLTVVFTFDFIGTYKTASNRFFNGMIDCIQITTPNKTYRYDFSEGAGTTVYDRGTGSPVNGTIQNADLTTFWGTDDKATPFNLLNGFDLWQNDTDASVYLRVPFDVNGNSIKTDGDAVTGYTWISRNPAGKGHNNAESEIENYPSPAMNAAHDDLSLDNPYPFAELCAEVDGQMFADISNDKLITNILTYSKHQIGTALTRIKKYLKHDS